MRKGGSGIMPLEGIITACFFATWAGLALGGIFLFYRGKDAAFKRRWWPRYVTLCGVILVAFMATLTSLAPKAPPAWTMLAFAAPFVALIVYLNIRGTKFCDGCGAMLMAGSLMFLRMNFCPRCGAPLGGKAPAAPSRPDADID